MLLQVVNSLGVIFTAKTVEAATIINNPNGDLPVLASSLTKLIKNLQNIVSLVAGAIAIGMIIWGGVLYITSGGDEEKNKNAKKVLTYAIVGILIILLAQILVVIFIRALGGDLTGAGGGGGGGAN